MPKIVILGSCKFEPYEILAVPKRTGGDDEAGYAEACKTFYPAIDAADEVWVYAPEGMNALDHTQRDIAYARSRGKTVRVLAQVRVGGLACIMCKRLIRNHSPQETAVCFKALACSKWGREHSIG